MEALNAALIKLSNDLGDTHRAGANVLRQALFAPQPSVWAQVAGGSSRLCGVVLYSPVFSTVRGGAGAYVSDLWVDSSARGKGLGSALLKHAANRAASLWGCVFMRLAVYHHNTKARSLYEELGFEPAKDETVMVLAGQAFQQMRRQQ